MAVNLINPSSTFAFPPASQSAFGTLETGELTPVVQLDFVYGLNTQTGVVSTANGATVDTLNSRLRVQSGTNSAGSGIFTSRRILKYRPGQGITARFTGVFDVGTAGNTQIIGVGNAVDGYFFGYNGTQFGILHRNNSVDTWIPQSTWNNDTANGSGPSSFNWNHQFGNVMMIKYPFLGFGNTRFFVQNSISSDFILVHTIQSTNFTTATQLTNPNLFFYAQSINSGNTTNLKLFVGSAGIFISGVRSFIGNGIWGTDNNKSGITTETVIFSVQNAATFNGVTNRSLIRLNSLSVGSNATGNNISIVRLRIGATVGGTPSFTTINGTTADNGVTITAGNSIASVDVAGTTSSGGNYVYGLSTGTGTALVIDLIPYELFIAPGEILTIGGAATGSSTITAALNWSEDI